MDGYIEKDCRVMLENLKKDTILFCSLILRDN